LLVALLQTEEFWLGSIECVPVIQVDEVFASLVGANRYSLLGEARVQLNIPNLQDPVGVERIDPAALLINYHIDDVVVLQRGSSSDIDTLDGLLSDHIVMCKHILLVQE
jgi:hypothetical protein